jgi:3-oxoacyl-(acyl-carrier-protein) synthase
MQAHLREGGRVPIFTSPTTTAGNISSWVAQEYLLQGGALRSVANITTSMTCSSAFHSLLVAKSFVGSRMCRAALFGGAEACLTPYTVAQLEALRIYTTSTDAWPCRPCVESEEAPNSVALGEGAGTALLLADDGREVSGDLELLGLGWSMEEIPSATGISLDGQAFEASMRMALAQIESVGGVDGVVLHAPGSRRGDEAELQAVSRVFPDADILSTKHLTGHTYAASGMLSLQLAQAVLYGAEWGGFPYPVRCRSGLLNSPRAIAINTAGFGGNAITVIVGVPRR